MRPLTLRGMERPRRGLSFSLELPKAKPQNKWMRFLPWEVWAAVTFTAAKPLRAALGCNGTDPRSQRYFDEYLNDFAHGRLLLRVIQLCHERLIPPGNTATERQARMDRWLPPSWSYDDAAGMLSWNRPTRFGSPPVNLEMIPGSCRLLTGPLEAEVVRAALDEDDAVAHWQDNGMVWVFARAARSASTRSP